MSGAILYLKITCNCKAFMRIHQETEEKRHLFQKGNSVKELWARNSASQT